MASLYDVLHLENPDTPEKKPEAPAPTNAKRIKAQAREILESPQYRLALLQRIQYKELPPQVEVLLYHYAYGKPPDRVEIEDVTERVKSATPEQLEARLLQLVQVARTMREAAQKDDDVTPPGAIH